MRSFPCARRLSRQFALSAVGLRSAPVRAVMVVVILVLSAANSGCALNQMSTVDQRPDGSYKLTCRTALPQCLERAEQVCHGNRYVVMRAVDHHDYMGGESTVGETQVRTSEALVTCGKKGKSLWGSEPDPMAMSEGNHPPAPSAPAKACVPGTTQACIGPAACRGGQSCLADGAGFSRCDCGENSKAAAGSSTAPMAGAAATGPTTLPPTAPLAGATPPPSRDGPSGASVPAPPPPAPRAPSSATASPRP